MEFYIYIYSTKKNNIQKLKTKNYLTHTTKIIMIKSNVYILPQENLLYLIFNKIKLNAINVFEFFLQIAP